MSALLEVVGVRKRFGPLEALRGVDLAIGEAEAVGLIGDNGAGKSTLVKILSGVYGPTSGALRLSGSDVHFASPLDARAAGIEMIYQDLALCPDLDVAANVFLGRELRHRIGPFTVLDRVAMRAAARHVMQELGSAVEPTRLVGALSGGERQLVAVARALQFQPRLFLMDEPTAALSAEKIRLLMDLIGRLKERGVAVLLISHRFTDILHVCDRVVVVRQGLIAGELRPAENTPEHAMAAMLALMTGDDETAAA
jgi:simple sugar transport system ATP-binding protein